MATNALPITLKESLFRAFKNTGFNSGSVNLPRVSTADA